MNISRTHVSRSLGISKAAVSQWFAEGSRPPADRCPDIERAMAGKATCEQLRPDVRWQRVPDPDWPHPQGRPCIDVAAPAAIQPAPAAAQQPLEQTSA
jgi:hypothetical protein